MEQATVNKSKDLIYNALGNVTGITDFIVTLIDSTSSTSVVATTITELSNGLYRVAFTPDVVGKWAIIIASVTNGDNARLSVDVLAYDHTDLKVEHDQSQTAISNISPTSGGGFV